LAWFGTILGFRQQLQRADRILPRPMDGGDLVQSESRKPATKAPRIYRGVCSVPGCGRVLRAKGLCPAHYFRLTTTGDANVGLPIGGGRWTQDKADTIAADRGVKLLDPFVRVDYPIRFECLTCGYQGESTVHRIRNSTQPCWPCSRIAAGRHRRLSSETIRADFAEAGFDLVGTYQRSRIPVEVRCRTCGRESLVRLDNVRSRGTGCSWCRFDRLSAKYRLTEDEVEARAELARIRLLEPFTSTHHAIRVECLECGYQSRRRINWSAPAKGCVRCGHRPFDFTAPSVLYLLHHEALDALKIGVTNAGTNRLRDHRREGWEVAGRVKGTGEAVYLAERAVLGWWREELALPPHVSSNSMPQGGWTETVSASAVSIPDVLAFMRDAVSASEVGGPGSSAYVCPCAPQTVGVGVRCRAEGAVTTRSLRRSPAG
jgi:hypothetical protein